MTEIRSAAYVCTDAPKAYLHVGYRSKDDPYPRVWIRTYDKLVQEFTTAKLTEGPDYMDYDIGLCKSEEAMQTLVAFLDTLTLQIARISNTELMKPTEGENDKNETGPPK